MQPFLPFSTQKGYVYFVTDGDLIKIGWTRLWPPSIRVKQQQTGNGRWLEFLGYIPGSPHAERRYQKRFERQRVHGEWFRRTPALDDLIRAANSIDFMDLVG